MKWNVRFLPEAEKDFERLAGNQRMLIAKAIDKVSGNPLPVYEGGFGKPLGNRSGNNLTGFMKIKLKDAGLRVVYKIVRTETEMLIIVIGVRSDDEVYDIAEKRARRHDL